MRSFAATVVCLFAAMSTLDGAPASSVPRLPARERALILEAYHLWSALADQIWPGTATLKAPMVYVGEQHEYAIGFERPLEGFRDTGESLIGKPIEVRDRILSLNMAATFPLQGSAAVVIGSPEATKRSFGAWVLTACHEMFHVFQAANNANEKVAELQIGPRDESSWQINFPFPYRDADVMRLIHLQGYLAWLAVGSSNWEDAAYNVGTAVEAARVYRSHLVRLEGNEKAYRYSQFQEWTEGVAWYFEYKLAQKAAAGAYQPARDYDSLPRSQRYEAVWRESYETRPFLAKHAGRAAKDRNAFYHLGAGKALALDKVDADWEKAVLHARRLAR